MPSRCRYGASAVAAAKPSSELSCSLYVASGADIISARSSLLAPERRLGRQLELEQQQRASGDGIDVTGCVLVVGGVRGRFELGVEEERPARVRHVVASRRQRERHD